MLTERFISTGEVRLNVAEGPRTGPTLVLLHGGSGRWRYSFGSIIPDLVERWHVLAVDLRGHGKSGHVAGCYRLQDYARDIVALLRSLPEPVIVFGHSLGAQIALLVSVEQPMRALILGDIPFTNDTLRSALVANRPNLMEWHRLSGRTQAEIIPALEQLPIVRKQLTPRPAVEAFGKGHPWFAEMALNLALLDPDMLAAVLEFEQMHALLQPYEIFPQLTCPVLILQGDPSFGGMLPDHEVEHALALLRNAKHVKFEGIGHPLHNEQKEPVLSALLEFLDSL
jgi:pimeloyl-ACP methyl ester carboxylesterase